tara:strand:+ start:378567 stop:379415 length:849 start_codon:yes stop_codon:yes gene_type:complete
MKVVKKVDMKIKYSILIISLFVSCFTFSQRKPKIKGSKVVVEVREELEPFNAITLDDNLEITLKKSVNFGYSLSIDDNLVDVLKFKVVDNKLTISSFYDITSKKKMEITVFYDNLNSITIHDGKIKTEDIVTSDALSVTTYGSSRLTLNANVTIMDVLMLENSSADLIISADSLNITLKDRIDAQIYAVSKNNNLEMFKNAQVKMEGNSDIFDIHLYENASLKAENLEASDINLTIESSASAYINALNSLSLSSKETAKTYFYGSGKINIIDFLDTSVLSKR